MIFLRNLPRVEFGAEDPVIEGMAAFRQVRRISANRASSPPEWVVREPLGFSGSREEAPKQPATESRGAKIRPARPRKAAPPKLGRSGGITPRIAPLEQNRPVGQPENNKYCSRISEETSTPTSANSMGTKSRPRCPIRRRFRYPSCFRVLWVAFPLARCGFVGLFCARSRSALGMFSVAVVSSAIFARARVGRWVCPRLRWFR